MSTRVDARRLHIALTRFRRRVRLDVVYDIGAHRGQWTALVRRSLPGARFFLFEANEAHVASLANIGEPYFIAVLSSAEKPVEFYSTGRAGDSYFREATPNYEDVEATRVHATTLERLMAQHDLPDPDLIKADVQGAELDVILGGLPATRGAKLVLLECPIVEYNVGAPSIDEYFRFMDEQGFVPVDVVNGIWHGRRLIHVDILFANARVHRELVP